MSIITCCNPIVKQVSGLQGLNEWRNIQDIVRVTFKAFHDVLKAQGDAIKTLERVMDTKANRNEVASALAAKASAADLSGRMHDLESMLFRKADVTVCYCIEWDVPCTQASILRGKRTPEPLVPCPLNCSTLKAQDDGQHCAIYVPLQTIYIPVLIDLLATALYMCTKQSAAVHKPGRACNQPSHMSAGTGTDGRALLALQDMNKRALTSEVEQVLGARLGDVSAGLDSKPSFTDLDHLKEHADISIANMQADIARLHRSLVDMKSEVADRATVTEVSQALRTKADQAEVDAVLARKARFLGTPNSDIRCSESVCFSVHI